MSADQQTESMARFIPASAMVRVVPGYQFSKGNFGQGYYRIADQQTVGVRPGEQQASVGINDLQIEGQKFSEVEGKSLANSKNNIRKKIAQRSNTIKGKIKELINEYPADVEVLCIVFDKYYSKAFHCVEYNGATFGSKWKEIHKFLLEKMNGVYGDIPVPTALTDTPEHKAASALLGHAAQKNIITRSQMQQVLQLLAPVPKKRVNIKRGPGLSVQDEGGDDDNGDDSGEEEEEQDIATTTAPGRLPPSETGEYGDASVPLLLTMSTNCWVSLLQRSPLQTDNVFHKIEGCQTLMKEILKSFLKLLFKSMHLLPLKLLLV